MFRFLILLVALSINNQIYARISFKRETISGFPQYYCTAANAIYYHRLVNLIGSIQKYNYNSLVEIAVYDLGLDEEMVNNLNKMRKVNVYHLKDKNSDLLSELKWFAWKPAVIKESLEMFPYVLWLDAGSTVLKHLEPLFKYIAKYGYFVCTIGDLNWQGNPDPPHPVGWGTTTYVKEKFKLDAPERSWILPKESVMGGVVGSCKDPVLSNSLIDEWYALTDDIRNFSEDGTAPGGSGCARNDQILLSIIAYTKRLKIHLQDWAQSVPMILSIDEGDIPFHITWYANSVSDQTSIYSSRYDTRNFYDYYNYIRLK